MRLILRISVVMSSRILRRRLGGYDYFFQAAGSGDEERSVKTVPSPIYRGRCLR